jgi:hypothetical protein
VLELRKLGSLVMRWLVFGRFLNVLCILRDNESLMFFPRGTEILVKVLLCHFLKRVEAGTPNHHVCLPGALPGLGEQATLSAFVNPGHLSVLGDKGLFLWQRDLILQDFYYGVLPGLVHFHVLLIRGKNGVTKSLTGSIYSQGVVM